MKKIVSLVLAMSMVLSMFVSAFAATKTLSDIADTKYAGSVEALVELGVIDGLPDGTYGPEKEVTRAQLAKMLVICLGLGDSVEALEGKTVFTDVADSHWATGYINAAVQSKVIAGYPDGTFKPEKNVSYAEAITMVIRALGYGNVVDTEGTWPTAYMLKAVELELLDDMDSPKSGEAALRGNVAILLWNMLRTPMWKITSESEGMGMTSQADALMLNVKFPSYRYVEEVKVNDIDIDEGEVTLSLVVGYEKEEDEYIPVTTSGKVEDIDLPRTLIGMTVSSLIKDYKEAEKATILTLTPKYSLVEGVVTKVTSNEDQEIKTVEIDGAEYKFTSNTNNQVSSFVEDKTYVVAEIDGKKVNVIAELPTEATEVKKIKKMESAIDEDALVIIDGEWSSREDIEVGDVYTEVEIDEATSYFMVARERVEGTFESYTWEEEESTNVYIEVDGEKYNADEDVLEGNIKEGEDNDKDVTTAKLREEEKDNKFLDKDVELVLNYLGQVVAMYFGEVAELDADGDIYAVTSNGYWDDSTSTGKEYYIKLAGLDGEEESYKFEQGFVFDETHAAIEEGLYAEGEPVFVWVNFNADGDIEELVVLNGATEAKDLGESDYKAIEVVEEFDDENSYLGNYNVSASTVVMTVTPVENDKESVVGFEVEVSEGAEALEGVPSGIVVYDIDRDTRAKFVLVSEEAKSQDLNFGLVESVRESRGVVYVTISGTEYKANLDKDDYADLLGKLENNLTVEDVAEFKDLYVSFTENNEKITITKVLVPANLVEAAVVTEVDGEYVTIKVVDDDNTDLLDTLFTDVKGVTAVTDGYELCTTTPAVLELFENIQFIKGSASTDKENKVEFDADIEDLGEGIENVDFAKGDRIIISVEDAEIDMVIVVEGFAHDDELRADENKIDAYLVVDAQ